jgi:hypothetical protein
VYSRFEPINRVRGYEFEGYERTVDSHVRNLRRKIGDQEAVLLQTHDADSFLTFIRRVGIPGDQPQPDPASLDYAAMNNVAGETGQPGLGPPMSGEEARAIIACGR